MYFLRKQTSNLVRVLCSREKLRESEYFCEHSKFGENYWREHFKILVITKRVKQAFSRVKKTWKKNLCLNREKNPICSSKFWKF